MKTPIGIALILAISAALAGCDRGGAAPGDNRWEASVSCPETVAHKTDAWSTTGYVAGLKAAAVAGNDFRRVLYTGRNLQLVAMTLQPGEHMGAEAHADHDQFFRIEEGVGEVHVNGQQTPVADGSGVVVPSGALHDIVNTGKRPLRLFTIYSPPAYQRDMVRQSSADADARTDPFDGCVSE